MKAMQRLMHCSRLSRVFTYWYDLARRIDRRCWQWSKRGLASFPRSLLTRQVGPAVECSHHDSTVLSNRWISSPPPPSRSLRVSTIITVSPSLVRRRVSGQFARLVLASLFPLFLFVTLLYVISVLSICNSVSLFPPCRFAVLSLLLLTFHACLS